MLRGGPIFWLVWVLCFFPFAIYQTMMRNGDAPELTPIQIALFAGATPLLGWMLGRLAESKFRQMREERAAAKPKKE